MGLLANLKLLWKNRAVIKAVSTEVDQIKGAYMSKAKPGISTSEFWLTLLGVATTLAETFRGNIDPKWGAIISASLTLGYALVRGFTKSAASAASVAPASPTTETK